MRLFVALDLEESLRAKIATYIQGLQGFAPDVRWASPEALHVTLKFIGERADEELERITGALQSIRVSPIELAFRGYGFFPSAKSPRVFWLGIESPAALATLAAQVDMALTSLGIPCEQHAFSPHLTLARTGSGAPRLPREPAAKSKFQRLQEKVSALPVPDFGTMTAREFFLYQSRLSPKGSRYTKHATFQLQA